MYSDEMETSVSADCAYIMIIHSRSVLVPTAALLTLSAKAKDLRVQLVVKVCGTPTDREHRLSTQHRLSVPVTGPVCMQRPYQRLKPMIYIHNDMQHTEILKAVLAVLC